MVTATTTFYAGLRTRGFVVLLVVDGQLFRRYVEQYLDLAPSLRASDTLVLGNLAAHKMANVLKAFDAVGEKLLFYHPDFDSNVTRSSL